MKFLKGNSVDLNNRAKSLVLDGLISAHTSRILHLF